MELTNFKFKDWLFNQLPLYFHQNDSYVDNSGEGLLKRYLRNFGEEIDEQIIPFIENYINASSLEGERKFLTHIANTLGTPPDVWLGNDPSRYDRFLHYIVDIYKIKGTIRSYELMFILLGYIVNVIEYPESSVTRFDSDEHFDEGYKFDMGCPTCSDYSIFISPDGLDCSIGQYQAVSQAMVDLFNIIINFLEPINANLRDFVMMVDVCDEIDGCMDDSVKITLEDHTLFDTSQNMDEENFDTFTIISTQVVATSNCTIPPTLPALGIAFNERLNLDSPPDLTYYSLVFKGIIIDGVIYDLGEFKQQIGVSLTPLITLLNSTIPSSLGITFSNPWNYQGLYNVMSLLKANAPQGTHIHFTVIDAGADDSYNQLGWTPPSPLDPHNFVMGIVMESPELCYATYTISKQFGNPSGYIQDGATLTQLNCVPTDPSNPNTPNISSTYISGTTGVFSPGIIIDLNDLESTEGLLTGLGIGLFKLAQDNDYLYMTIWTKAAVQGLYIKNPDNSIYSRPPQTTSCDGNPLIPQE